jgi:hypothetical protein
MWVFLPVRHLADCAQNQQCSLTLILTFACREKGECSSTELLENNLALKILMYQHRSYLQFCWECHSNDLNGGNCLLGPLNYDWFWRLLFLKVNII